MALGSPGNNLLGTQAEPVIDQWLIAAQVVTEVGVDIDGRDR
jgi:hypothetical protein